MGEPAAGPLDCLPVGCRPPAFCCFGSLGRLGWKGVWVPGRKVRNPLSDPRVHPEQIVDGRDRLPYSSNLRNLRNLRFQIRNLGSDGIWPGAAWSNERTIQKCMAIRNVIAAQTLGRLGLSRPYRLTVFEPNQRNSCTTHSRLSGTTKGCWPTLSRISSVSHSRAVSIFLPSITRTDFPSAVDNVYSWT